MTYKIQTFLFSGVFPACALLLRTFNCVHAAIAASDPALTFDERVAPCAAMCRRDAQPTPPLRSRPCALQRTDPALPTRQVPCAPRGRGRA